VKLFGRSVVAGFGGMVGVALAASTASVLLGILAQRKVKQQLIGWSEALREQTERLREVYTDTDAG